jgi:hypothetical protein
MNRALDIAKKIITSTMVYPRDTRCIALSIA